MPPVFDEKDRAIRDARIAMWSERTGPRVGDFVVMSEGDVRRFTHDWGDDIQVTSGIGGDGDPQDKTGRPQSDPDGTCVVLPP